MLTPSPFVGAIEPYSPPPPEAPVDLRLDGNEGGPPPAGVLEEVVRAGPEIARR